MRSGQPGFQLPADSIAEALDFAARLEAEGVSYFSPSVGTYQSMFTPDVRAVMSRLATMRWR